MTKSILLFPGQGSQYVGMGKTAASELPEADELLSKAEKVLGLDMRNLLWEGPLEELKKTENTQPALFTASMMAMACLKHVGMTFDYVAGHSLGEYSALCAAGVFSFEDGLRLVRLRGELMAKAGSIRPGAMSAVLGLEAENVEQAVKGASSDGEVVVANYNSPGQIVISGEVAAVSRAEELSRESGAKKVIRLPVSGAFHSPLMDFATEGLKEGLNAIDFSDPSVPVITNVRAEPCSQAKDLKQLLVSQLTSPVRWSESMSKALELQCGQAFEVGAGKVLMGLARGISRELKVTPIESLTDAQNAHSII